ncbi:uncharacterized protein [Arachis hypogaea]|uniref:uncharacterized protein n=1 Tax=Arachis hypogaea TaxID=3818 RepID=UPI003B213276
MNEEKPFDLCPVIPVSKEDFDEWCKLWKAVLIVKVLGKRVYLSFMEQRLNRDWVKKGKINVIDMNHDYFLVRFLNKEDYAHALMGGPWMITGHYLIVQHWRPFFPSSKGQMKKIAVWIRIPNLPIELCNHHFFVAIGSSFGTMLKIDRATSIHSKKRFAHICVEIDLSKKLVPRISVLGCTLNVEYKAVKEGGKIIGASKEANCDEDQHNQRPNQNPPDFGPWMMVKRPLRRKQEKAPGGNRKQNQLTG